MKHEVFPFEAHVKDRLTELTGKVIARTEYPEDKWVYFVQLDRDWQGRFQEAEMIEAWRLKEFKPEETHSYGTLPPHPPKDVPT